MMSSEKKIFMARYGDASHIPDINRRNPSFDHMMALAASMHNDHASNEHIVKGCDYGFYAVHDAAFETYVKRFGNYHPNDPHAEDENEDL